MKNCVICGCLIDDYEDDICLCCLDDISEGDAGEEVYD